MPAKKFPTGQDNLEILMDKIIRIGSRESKLAVVQSEIIINKIKEISPETKIELVTMKTTGDKILDKTLDKIGGKGLFLKELEVALIENRVDLCVHSLKDMPAEMNENLPIKSYFRRESAEDVFVLPKNKKEFDKSLPVGCSSPRRVAQFLKIVPDAKIKQVRGNVLTRLEKLDKGEYSALILAKAGLKRLGLENRISYEFNYDEMVPSAGQGILAIQARCDEKYDFLDKLNDYNAQICAQTERKISEKLGGDCTAPVGVFADTENDKITVRVFFENKFYKFVEKLSDLNIIADKIVSEILTEKVEIK